MSAKPSARLAHLDDKALKELIARVAAAVDKTGVEGIGAAVQMLRRAGFRGDEHVGVSKEDFAACERLEVEWYGGQILDIVKGESWFAVNSWLNCCEKYTGHTPGTFA